ncbi:hypothetical protein IFR05_008613 [Cadophora sp. M221]|nr:hypothetical protein IFR05_008613 [Cadophora sp. M221]
MDPLSITASTFALARLCMKVSTTIYEFTTDTRDVDTNVQNLYRGLGSLSQVLTNISTAWKENPLVAVAQTGPDGNLWICVKDNVGNCGVVLKKLEATLDKVSAENAVGKGFMRRPVKQIRLNLNKKDIQGFGSEVQTYERALAIAFNAINALETIETGIQDLSQSLRQRQPLGVGASSEATKSLEEFLRAANTFKSSASTVVNGDTSTVRGGLTSQDGGSIFGDSLSDDRYEIIQSWIPPPSPLGTRGTSTAVGSTQQGGLNHRGSLPELMAVLETVTQMADQYRNSEQERNSSKDEQLRSLEMENRALEQRLEESKAAQKSLDIEGMDLKTKISGLEDQTRQQAAVAANHVEDQSRSSKVIARLSEELRHSQKYSARLKFDVGELILELKNAENNAAREREEFNTKLSIRERELCQELDQELKRAAALEELNFDLEKECKDYKSRVKKLDYDLAVARDERVEMEVRLHMADRRAQDLGKQTAQLGAECEDFKGLVKELEGKLDSAQNRCISRSNALSNQNQKAKETERILRQLASLQEQQSQLLSAYSTPLESGTADQEPEDRPASVLASKDEEQTEYKIIATKEHATQEESNAVANTDGASDTRNSVTASQQTELRPARVLATKDETQHKQQNETNTIASTEQSVQKDKQSMELFRKGIRRHLAKTPTGSEHGPVLRNSTEIVYYDWREAEEAQVVA